MNIKPRIVLFSLQTSETDNKEFQSYIESLLSEYGFKRLIGSYNGVLEQSYLVVASEDSALDLVLGLAKNFKQESVLIVDEERKAVLKYIDSNETVHLGQFVSVNAIEVQNFDNWTLDGTNYYSVR
jgi:hypothetical protein